MEAKIKVLYINHTANIGGTETNLFNIIRFASSSSFQPVGVLLPTEGPFSSYLKSLGVPVGIISYYGIRAKNPFRYFQTLGMLYAWIHRVKPDIIHLNHQWLIAYAYRIGKLMGVPVVCHFRDFADAEYFQHNRRYLSNVSRVIAISRAVEDRLVANGIPSDRIIQIYDGIDLQKFNPQRALTQSKKNVQGDNTIVIGYVGRLVQWKGVEDLLLAAYYLLKERPRGVRFVFVGEGEDGGRYVTELKDMAKNLGISDLVFFAGFQPNVSAALASMDVVVLPSHGEPLGNIVLEAMAMGKLVIATNDGGAAEIISSQVDGFLVPPKDPVMLARTIQQVLDLPNEIQRQISWSATKKIEKYFSIQSQVKNLAKLYHDVIKT